MALWRKLIAAGAPEDLIKTRHGFGYRLNPLYGSAPGESNLTLPQAAELKAVNQELRRVLEQLRSTQVELQEKNQALEAARHQLQERVGEGTAALRTTNQLLHHQQRVSRVLFDSIDEGVCLFERLPRRADGRRDYRFLAMNPAMQTMFGIADLSGQSIRDHFPDEVEDWYDDYDRVLETGQAIRCERESKPQAMVLEIFITRVEDRLGHRLLAVIRNLERARAEAMLRQNLDHTQRLRELGSRFITIDQIQDLYDEIVATAMAVMGADRGSLQLLDPSRQELDLLAWYGFHPEAAAFWQRVRVGTGSVCSRALGRGERAMVADVETDEALAHSPNLHYFRLCSIRAVQSTPLISRSGELIGVFSTHWCRPHQPSDRDWQFLDLLSRQTADLLEHHRATLALKQREQQLQLLISNGCVCVAMFDHRMHYLAVSQRWVETYQLGSVEAVLGRCHYDLLSIPDRWRQVHQQRLAGVGQRCDEDQYTLPDGSLQWLKWEVQPWRTDTGAVVGLLMFFEDISDRKRSEQALQDSQQQLQAILDHSPAVVYLVDAQQQYQLVNRCFATLLATTPDQIIGQTLQDVWPPALADDLAAHHRQVLATEQLLQVEETLVDREGKPHTFLTVKFPLRDATGTAWAVCGIATDITDRKELEALFHRGQRLESLGVLASGMAHNLNNVLTPMITISQLLRLQQANLDRRSQEMLEALEASAKQGAEMVKQIMTFGRGSDGNPVPLQIADLLQEVINLVQQSFPPSITLRCVLPHQPLGLVVADPAQLHQVLMNLCLNARDAMAEGGTLTLAAQNCVMDDQEAAKHLHAQAGAYLRVTVTDTGTGIAPELLDRIFEPFFTTKAIEQGTGLGLSTSLGIIQSHGGFLEVVSRVGQGTEMRAYLPVADL